MFSLQFSFFRKKAEERKILLFGLQRSGTNFLQSLVSLNYPGCSFVNSETRNNITHKHFRIYDDKTLIPEPKFLNKHIFPNFIDFEKTLPAESKPDLYLVISKDPFSWFGSYVQWSKKNDWIPPAYHYIEEYVHFYEKWKKFSEQSPDIIFVRYSDLLTDPLQVLHTIGKRLQLPPLQKLKSTKKVYASKRFTGSKKEGFLKKDYLKNININDLEIINSNLNNSLMEFLGYERYITNS